jgi:DNA-binding NarL/FixJ family response regulator
VVQEHVGVFIVAGNRLLREALTRILTKKSDICVLGAAPFSPEVVDQIAASRPDILLLNAVEAVCPPRLCLSLFKYVAKQGTEIPSARIKLQLGLTRREQQLIPFLTRGLTNKEIATHLNLSEQTVKNHVHRMLQKMGASDRLTVVELCRIQGLSI